jgi:3-methyladenine DNA glycosylase AlkD
MASTAAQLKKELRSLGDADIARHSGRFFKTAEGEYGAGDKFLGIRVPVIRKAVARNRDVSLRAVLSLLRSKYHEERLYAVLSLVDRYQHTDGEAKRDIFEHYLQNLRFVNNWDLVDSSAHLIVGPQLEERGRTLLYRLAKSSDLWERRIAIMSTYHFIRQEDFDDTLAIATLLLDDNEDLIHKAVGWMLREVGNRDRKIEESFLQSHYRDMPRTMLRYAIEKFPEGRRKAYLNGRV